MLQEDKFFKTSDKKRIWQRYCGFLNLSLKEFMEIQQYLLEEQIELVADSLLGRKIMQGKKPRSIEEFRRVVPLTTYEDYEPYFSKKDDTVLAEKPYYWAHTAGQGGKFKWVPVNLRAHERASLATIGAWILATASKEGEVNVGPGGRMLFNLPVRPYFSGCLAFGLMERISFISIPSLEEAEQMEFQDRIERSFQMALRTGADFLASLSSVLVKMGETFEKQKVEFGFSFSMLHPLVLWRLLRAQFRCKIVEKRNLLPKDLWPVRAIFGWGMDTSAYAEKIAYYWGKKPYQLYGATEGGVIALQHWEKEELVFLPTSSFWEFVPEEEWLKSREDKSYQPLTVLLNEVQQGETYELILTNFYGMPFLRYRLGDLIKITTSGNGGLPRMVFKSRADDLIDIAGLTRLDEKTIWQALVDTGVEFEDWSMRKEYEKGEPVLRLYIELKNNISEESLQHLLHEQLRSTNPQYEELVTTLITHPLRVTLLRQGTFQRYYEEKRKEGADLAHLKPTHMNASDVTIQKLLQLGKD